MGEEVKHQRVIPQLKKYSAKTDFWILINYGEIYFKKSDQIFYRDADFVKSDSNSYDLKKWDKNNVIRIKLAETKTLLFDLGTIFNYKGFPICEPKEESKYLHTNNIVISNKPKNFMITAIDKVFEDTNYPVYNGDLNDKEIFYHCENRTFSKIKKNNHNNSNNSNNDKRKDNIIQESSEYIIPNYLIRKRFYYKSYSGINSILFNKLKKGILNKNTFNNQWIVEYNSDLIKKIDLIFLAKYWFTKEYENNSSTGLGRLNKQINKFWKKLLHNRTGSINYIQSTLNFPIPYDFKIKVKILGQWITDYNSKEKKFFAYKILSFTRDLSFVRDENSKKIIADLYSTDGFFALDINDRSSTDQRENKDIKGSGSRVISNNSVKKYDYENDNKPTSSYLETITTKLIVDDDSDRDELNVKFIQREDQEFAYVANLFIKQEAKGLGDDLEHSDGNSLLQKNNVVKDTVESFKCIMDAMEILKKKYSQFNYQFITINDSISSPYTVMQLNLTARKKMHTIDELLIIKVIFNDLEYCIIESGAGKCIGIFENKGFPLKDQNDINLTNFLNFIVKEYGYMWSSFFADKKANFIDGNNLNHVASKIKKHGFLRKNFNYDILRPIYHKSVVKEGITLEEDLAKRIHSRFK